jgi:16S rRNA G966 N2-methylase RsmD
MIHALKEIIKKLAEKNPNESPLHIDSNEFFKEWYYEHGNAYLFTFKNHLGVTDLQYAELYSLIKQYTTTDIKHDKPVTDILFHGSQDFKKTFQEIVDAFIEGSNAKTGINWDSFTELYESLLNNSVILDARYGSCTLLLPPTLHLKLSQVCAQSGYIDSCGKQIYAKRIDKARSSKLIDRLSSYLLARISKTDRRPAVGKIKFGLWAFENFLKNELNEKGIEALKIYAHKVKIGNEKISTVVNKIRDDVPFLRDHLEFGIESNETTDGTIWILQDRSIDYKSNDNHVGNKRYLLCYHQFFKNCNPLHIFNENKPAWVAPITIPHSLLGAMVNITRPWSSETLIHDPFCGTGSLILEMLKDDQSIATGSDNAVETTFLFKDNISFLSDENIIYYNNVFLSHIINNQNKPFVLKNLLEFKNCQETLKIDQFYEERIEEYITPALSLFLKIVNETEHFDFEKGAVPEYDFSKSLPALEKLDIKARLVFYITLRAQKNKSDAHSDDCFFSTEFIKEAVKLHSQFSIYRKWIRLKKTEQHHPVLTDVLTKQKHSKFTQLSVSPSTLQNSYALCESRVKQNDAADDAAYEDGSFDVVVTDPPYGFNTDEESLKLAKLYNDFLKVWIKKIKPKGHLVICLPQETYNGQALPFCTNASLVTSTIISAAAQLGKQIILPARVMPSYSPGLKPPYYWKSDKVLKRVVLHFQIDNKN